MIGPDLCRLSRISPFHPSLAREFTLEQHLLDRVPGLPLDLTLTDQAIVFAWSAVATAAACPLCHQQSPRIHRRYSRLAC